MSVVLISPPVAKACEPLLGIATLKAYLEGHGIPCACFDANVEAQEWLLQTERLDAAAGAVNDRGTDAPSRVRKLARSWPTLRPQLERLKASLRSPEGYRDVNRYRTATTSLNRALALTGAAHGLDQGAPVTVSLTDYLDGRYCDMASASVAQAAREPELNLFYEYFRDELIPRVKALEPRVIGLSLIFRNQLLCGAVLAGMLRRAIPGAHITLGGELVSAWVDILADGHLLDLADSILPYEGEHGLLALARVIDATARGATPDYARVPNLCWRDEMGRFHRNPTSKPNALAEVPAPDYSFAPWHLYFAPERTAPLVAARGCYWNRCTFCPEVVNPETRLRLARAERLTADMDRLYSEHGATCFHFIDSALPPKLLKAVATHVRDNALPYHWYGFSRLETHLFRPGFAEHLGRGGCRMLKLGLETASQRLLDVMDKQQNVDDVSRILHALRAARVMVHGFIMFGTPFETEEDAEATRRFVAEHKDCIQFLNCSIMNLAKGSPMALDPPRHGIDRVVPFTIGDHVLDLALYDNFEGRGWGRGGARNFLQRRFLKDPAVRPLHLRTPVHFDSNHSVFFHNVVFGDKGVFGDQSVFGDKGVSGDEGLSGDAAGSSAASSSL